MRPQDVVPHDAHCIINSRNWVDKLTRRQGLSLSTRVAEVASFRRLLNLSLDVVGDIAPHNQLHLL